MPDFYDWLMAQAQAAANSLPVPSDTYDYGMPLDQLRQQVAQEAARRTQEAELQAFNDMAQTSGGAPTQVMPTGGGGDFNVFLESAMDAASATLIGNMVNEVFNAQPRTLSSIHSTLNYGPNAGADTYGTAVGGDWGPSGSSSGSSSDSGSGSGYSGVGGYYGTDQTLYPAQTETQTIYPEAAANPFGSQ